MPQTAVQNEALRLFLRTGQITDLTKYFNEGGAADVTIHRHFETMEAFVTEAEYKGTESVEEVW